GMTTGSDGRSLARTNSTIAAALAISAAVIHSVNAEPRSLAAGSGWVRRAGTGALATSPSWVGGGELLTAVEPVAAPGVLGVQLFDLAPQRSEVCFEFLHGEPHCDVLRTVPVEG